MNDPDSYDILAYTEHFEVIVVEDMEGLVYGVYNKETGVIEYRGEVFSNTINKLDELQEAYLSALAVLDEDGRLNIDAEPYVTVKENIH